MNKFMEEHTLKLVSVPVDMNTAAITGARIGMAKADRIAIILAMGTSTAAVVDITLKQHNAATAGTSKDLSVANPYYKKIAAATSFTKVVPTAAAANYVLSADLAADSGIVVFEVNGEDLDVDGGFAWISVDIADSTAAKLLGATYVASSTRFLPAYAEVI